MDQQMNRGTALFFLGAATGALTLALITPRNGKELRERIKDSVRRVRSKTDEAVDDIEENLKAARSGAKDRLSSAKEATEGLTANK